jgi:hypothetical protein
VQNSLQAEMLEFAAPEFVKKLWWGALLAQIAAVGATIAMSALIATLVLMIWGAMAGWDPAPFFWALGAVGLVGPLACGATSLAGWWLLTSRDPGVGGVRKDALLRRVIRVTVIVAGACWVLVFVPPVAHGLMDLPPQVYIPLTGLIGLGLVVSTLVLVFATGPYVGQLGKRVGDDHLEHMGKVQMKLAGGAAIVTLISPAMLLAAVLLVPGLIIALMVYHAMVMRRVKWLVYGVM